LSRRHRKAGWRKGNIEAGEQRLCKPADLFVTHICFYAFDPKLAHKVCGRMAIRTIHDWEGQLFLAARFFAPLVRSSTLAVAATQEETRACPIAVRVVFARNASDTACLFDEAAVALLCANLANTMRDSFRDREFYALKFLLSVPRRPKAI
jgi:hypothetical protein